MGREYLHRGSSSTNFGERHLKYDVIKQFITRRMIRRGGASAEDIEKFMEAISDEIDTDQIDSSVITEEEAKLIKMKEKYHVPRIGDLQTRKPDGTFRFITCQFNNMSGKDVRERKLKVTKQLVNKYEIDALCGSEIGVNFSRTDPSNSFASWFEGDRSIRSTTSHNIHIPSSSKSRHLPGGTGMVVFNGLHQYAKKSTNDFRKLGRYCSWVFYVNPTHRFRLVVAYSTGTQTPRGLSTIYQQQLAYIRNKGLNTTPAALLRRDLRQVLKQWIKEGDRIALCVDCNEHVYSGKLASMLQGIGMIERSQEWWSHHEPNTFISGTQQIDGLFTTEDVDISSFLMLSFHESPGDHRSFVFDIPSTCVLGETPLKIDRPVARKLILSSPRTVNRYIVKRNRQFDIHRIDQRHLELRIQSAQCGLPLSPDLEQQWKRLHIQIDEIHIHSEKTCRILQFSELPWSEPVQYWYNKKRAYQEIASFLERGSGNLCNMLRTAERQLQLSNPLVLTLEQAKDGVQYCQFKIQGLKSTAWALRKVTQRNQLILAEESGDKEKIARLKQIASNETSRQRWRSITRRTKDTFDGSVTRLTEEIDGITVVHESEESVLSSLQGMVQRRFWSAHSAPSHHHPLLSRLLQYPSDSSLPSIILNPEFPLPEDLDEATTLLIQEIRRLHSALDSNTLPDLTVTEEDYRRCWSMKRERTSSSPSGIHVGMYKAALKDPRMVTFFSNYWTDILRFKVPPDRWYTGLQVALQKEPGNFDVTRHRMIQLYEADFNQLDKFIASYIGRILRHLGAIPEEHYAQKQSTAEDANMDKTLTFDLSRISRTPMVNVSVDAENCFDRISHVILMLLWYAITGDWLLVTMFLRIIGHMRLFQRTGYGDSSTSVGGPSMHQPFQGKGQGSGGAPSAWIHHSSLAILSYLRKGFRSSFLDPLTGNIFGSMGRLFVDDTNLYVTLEPDYADPLELYEAILDETQQATTCWGSLLIGGGGSAKQSKCYWQPTLYTVSEGTWDYVEVVEREILVPQDDGTFAKIKQLSPFESKKELGVKESVAGGSQDQLQSMQDKFRKWVMKIHNSHLQSSYAWVSYRLQIWPGIRYSLGTLTNDMESITDLLQDLYYKLLPSLGVVRTFRKVLRTIPQSFGGIGLWHLAAEQLAARLNLLLQHYQRDTVIGSKFRAMTRWLQLELGTNLLPFSLSYDKWSLLATHCWHKMLWRTIQWSGIEVYISDSEIPFPRENDICLMEYFYQQGCTVEDLRSLNRCRMALHLLFLSDVVTADGLHLESSMISEVNNVPIKSDYTFPPSFPSPADWRKWAAFWSRVSGPSFSTSRYLGCWTSRTHRGWKWYHDDASDTLYSYGDILEIYHKVGPGRTRSQRLYELADRREQSSPPPGLPASVHLCLDGQVRLLYVGPPLFSEVSKPNLPSDFWSFLSTWGGTWMWRNVVNSSTDLDWLINAIRDKTATWCTDGSYDKLVAPDISGVGWLIFDKETSHILYGNFFERSVDAGSYRGEMLGSLALHTLCSALESFYDLSPSSNTFLCDNESTLEEANKQRLRIPTKSSCSDILRHMRYMKTTLRMRFNYQHVGAHADDHNEWSNLTLEEQLNCRCDELAKDAVHLALSAPSSTTRFLFPREGVAVFVGGNKQTSDVAPSIRFHVGQMEARQALTQPYFVQGKLKAPPMSPAQFDSIDWVSRHRALSTSPDMYRIWLAKQTNNFSATGVQLSRYGMAIDEDRCPNCRTRGERSDHLCRCPDPGRTRLYKEQIQELEDWLIKSYAHPEIVYFLPKYLLLRGTREFLSLGTMSTPMEDLARDQDLIGWRNLTEGKISRLFLPLQQSYLRTTPSKISGATWVKQLIQRILYTTHSQWIFRNVTLHHQRDGILAKRRSRNLLREIELLLLTPEDELPSDSKHLLDYDLTALRNSPVETQENFVYVAKAAIRAGQRTSLGRAARFREQTRCLSMRQKLGIDEVEAQLRLTKSPLSLSERGNGPLLGISPPSRCRPHPSHTIANQASNKRLRKPD